MEYVVDITLKEVRGKNQCPLGHKVGEVFHIGDGVLCPWAAHTVLPFATALRFGGSIPWRDDRADEIDLCCPDPDCLVIFRLTRRPKPEGAKPGW